MAPRCPHTVRHTVSAKLRGAPLFNSIDAPLEVALTITAGDSNGQQSPLPHTLEPKVDECIFEVQSIVPG